MDDVRLTLAFDLATLQRLSDPAAAVADASQWSEHVGVVTDRPPHVLTKFTRDHGIQQDFSPDPTSAHETLDHLREHFDTGRYVHVGAATDHERRAAATDWEYLDVAEAAAEAGWELSTDASEPTGAGRVDTSTDDWP